MTEEINYKELCEELYLTLKENPWSRGYENCNKVIKKYEELHKPKMTRYPNGGEYFTDIVNYKKQQYALFWCNWYVLESGKLYQVRDDFIDELNEAYKEYKNQK
jgi:hypothetical protein